MILIGTCTVSVALSCWFCISSDTSISCAVPCPCDRYVLIGVRGRVGEKRQRQENVQHSDVDGADTSEFIHRNLRQLLPNEFVGDLEHAAESPLVGPHQITTRGASSDKLFNS